eukprot:1472248-Rhodomonas_salina.2
MLRRVACRAAPGTASSARTSRRTPAGRTSRTLLAKRHWLFVSVLSRHLSMLRVRTGKVTYTDVYR